MEKSELAREALGDQVFEYILRNKKAEWIKYHTRVTPSELEAYLPLL
jgi:glutamine synthetase